MNSENSRTSEYHVLVLKPTHKLDLKKDQKSVALSNLSICYTWENIEYSYNNNKFQILRNLNYQMDHIQYQMLKIILSILLRNVVKMLIIHQLEYM